MAKPQVGLGLLLLQGYWVWRAPALGWRALLQGLGSFGALLALTIVIWPSWIPHWVTTMRAFTPTWWNAAVWPAGLVAWPIAVGVARKAQPLQQLRLFSAAALLGSSHFALYHCTTLLVVTDNWLAVVFAWLIVMIVRGRPEAWMPWGWLLPAGILALDVTRWLLAQRRAAPIAIPPPA